VTTLRLRGITWNHSRAFPPLVAASQRYEELHPSMRIDWEKRTLDEFGHASLADLARSFDLLIVDHPMLGQVHRNQVLHDPILLNLEPHLEHIAIAQLQEDALGLCLESYWYEGCLYALPVDAAAPAASYRPDLLARMSRTPPETWGELISLAHTGAVCMPGFAADLFLNFLGMCASRGGLIETDDQFLDRACAEVCLEELRELALLIRPAIYEMNPIDIYEAMSSSDDFAYCPFAYSYSNYSRPGFARHPLLFASPVYLRDGTPLRTILGGTGIAVSARCASVAQALDYCLFIAGRDCQSHIYGPSGGQPASKSAWQSPLLNRVSNSFFERTLASIQAAQVRPRYAGYIQLQRSAGTEVAACLQGVLKPRQAIDRIEELYRRSRPAAQREKESMP
jgi:multiple sugar transport system substrate-binding protein